MGGTATPLSAGQGLSGEPQQFRNGPQRPCNQKGGGRKGFGDRFQCLYPLKVSLQLIVTPSRARECSREDHLPFLCSGARLLEPLPEPPSRLAMLPLLRGSGRGPAALGALCLSLTLHLLPRPLTCWLLWAFPSGASSPGPHCPASGCCDGSRLSCPLPGCGPGGQAAQCGDQAAQLASGALCPAGVSPSPGETGSAHLLQSVFWGWST